MFPRSNTLNRRHLLIACALSVSLAAPALAQTYPNRDINFVVQSSAGGGSDLFARALVDVMQKNQLVDQSIIIDNRPGGGGAVAYNYVAQRKGNPYYIGTIAGSFFTTPLLGRSPVNYKDFTPLAALVEDPYVMVVRAGSGLDSMEALAQRKTLRSGNTGPVTDQALLSRMLAKALNIEVRSIPFGGSGEELAALLGNHIDIQFGNPGEVLSQIRAGSVVPLAVSSAKRLPALPDVPTFGELNLNVELTQLRGVVAPKDISPEAIAYWEKVFKQVSETAQWQEFLAQNNATSIYLDSKAFGERMPKDSERYEVFMKEMGAIK